MRVVLDTNVIVSAGISTKGAPGGILELVISGKIRAYTTSHLWDELCKTVASIKIQTILQKYQRLMIFKNILKNLDTVIRKVPALEPTHKWVMNDEADNWVIQCAITAQVDCIISGDHHLISLGEQIEGIRIIQPTQFLTEWNQFHGSP